MTEINIHALVEMKINDPEKYKKYMGEWKAVQDDLNGLDKNADKPIKGRHSLDRENYTQEYLEKVIKEWQDRGIIV